MDIRVIMQKLQGLPNDHDRALSMAARSNGLPDPVNGPDIIFNNSRRMIRYKIRIRNLPYLEKNLKMRGFLKFSKVWTSL